MPGRPGAGTGGLKDFLWYMGDLLRDFLFLGGVRDRFLRCSLERERDRLLSLERDLTLRSEGLLRCPMLR